jgi:hypothetical protein
LRLATLPGGSSDYDSKESFEFCNIQGAFLALTHAGRGVVGLLAWSTAGLLATLAAWFGIGRSAFARRPWTMIALAVAISLLPVYHRGYDRVIALALLPAAVEIAAARRGLAWGYAALLTLWIANDTVMAHILKRWHFAPQNGPEDVAFCMALLASLWLIRRPRLDRIGE